MEASTVITKIIKKPDDPFCTRVSLGGTRRDGYYMTYRGKLTDAITVMETMLSEARKQLERGEPPVEDN